MRVMTPTDTELAAALKRVCRRLAGLAGAPALSLRFVLRQVGLSDPSVARILHEELTKKPETGEERDR